jgi:hypothetical protein
VAATLGVGCVQREPNLCDELVARCGGIDPANWYAWCQSDCVPDHARTIPCAENDACLLCDEEDPVGAPERVQLYGLPVSELEFLWTLSEGPGEPIHPEVEPLPTGGAFVDELDGDAGAWRAWAPEVDGFCEPGPNRYVESGVRSELGHLVLTAQDLPETDPLPYCPGGRCASGPYATCDEPPSACQYRDLPEASGIGYAAQAERWSATERETFGLGRYRVVLRADAVGAPIGPPASPMPGFVYAFFTQSHEPCRDGAPSPDTNTAEIDVEISSGEGSAAGGLRFCTSGQMCLLFSTWVSSTQGIATGGVTRHLVSGFRFRDPARAAAPHTYGWDWSDGDVRFVLDGDPQDCDEAVGGCDALHGSIAMCRHTRFVPRRPSALHLQLWRAWWAGAAPRGATATMSVDRVWHEPYPASSPGP